jgi:hypothetical protein
MATNQVMHYCGSCKGMKMHFQPSTSHVLHLLLSIFTFGIWIIAWALIAAKNASQKTCSVCGRVAGLFG